MDKNQATGLILISILMIAYFWFFADAPQQPENIENTKVEQVDENQAVTAKAEEVVKFQNDSSLNQSLINEYGDFAIAAKGESKITNFYTEKFLLELESYVL